MIEFDFMQEITATQLARQLKQVLNRVEFKGEEIIVFRNNHAIARLIPGPPHMNAFEALSDLYRTLPDKVSQNWLKDSRSFSQNLDELKDPWSS